MGEVLKKIRIYCGAIGLVVFDQIIKLIVVNNVSKMPSTVINNFLKFTYCENKGVAFSLGDGNVSFFIVVNLIIICGLILFFERNRNMFNLWSKCGFVMVIAGGSSNLLDRIFRGFVVDFINVNDFVQFAIFNVADVFIVVGMFMMIVGLFVKEFDEEKMF